MNNYIKKQIPLKFIFSSYYVIKLCIEIAVGGSKYEFSMERNKIL